MARRPKDTRKPAPVRSMELVGASPNILPSGSYERVYTVTYKPEGGGSFTGTVEEVNALLTALGFHEIAVRRNLMGGPDALFIEAKLTPVYLSPASETYWSM